jgi:hypothetical protein
MTTTPIRISEAFAHYLFATSYVIDYTDRAGDRASVHYSGDDVFRRAAQGLAKLREQGATAFTVTATFADGEETVTLAPPYALAHRDRFEADWRSADAYHVGESGDFDDLRAAKAAADALDALGDEWDVIVVERDGSSRPRVVYA